MASSIFPALSSHSGGLTSNLYVTSQMMDFHEEEDDPQPLPDYPVGMRSTRGGNHEQGQLVLSECNSSGTV